MSDYSFIILNKGEGLQLEIHIQEGQPLKIPSVSAHIVIVISYGSEGEALKKREARL